MSFTYNIHRDGTITPRPAPKSDSAIPLAPTSEGPRLSAEERRCEWLAMLIDERVTSRFRRIRIAELAIAIDVKPVDVLDLLNGLGCPEKRTQWSALDISDAQVVVELLRPELARASSPLETPRRADKEVASPPRATKTKPHPEAAMRRRLSRHQQLRAWLWMPLAARLPPHLHTRPCDKIRARAQAMGRGFAGPADANVETGTNLVSYWTERRLDGARDFWQIRDRGEFGSYSSHDDFGDESAP